MDPNPGHTLQQLWDDAELYISQKVTRSRDVTEDALHHAVRELQALPRASPPNNLFVQNLGKPNRGHTPPQNATLTRRALEEWERTLCENKAVASSKSSKKADPPSSSRMEERC